MTDTPQPITLVLLPGLDGTDVFFRPLLSALPAWVRPVVVQYPSDGDNDYTHLSGIVSNAVGDLGDYWVLGWSFSGPLALRLAARSPERLRGVILCASFVLPPRRLLARYRFAAVGAVLWTIRVARRVPALISANQNHVWRDKTETWRRVSSTTLARRVRALLAVDARDDLRRCEMPIVYLASSRDVVVPERNIEDVLLHAPSAEVIVLEGSHMALYTNALAAAGAICRVIRPVPQ